MKMREVVKGRCFFEKTIDQCLVVLCQVLCERVE